MRLKKAGYIEDRKFIIQPTQQVIDDALEGKEEGLGGALKGIFGGGGGGDDKKSDAVAAVSESVGSESSVVEEATTTTSVVEEVVSESQPESVDAAAQVESS